MWKPWSESDWDRTQFNRAHVISAVVIFSTRTSLHEGRWLDPIIFQCLTCSRNRGIQGGVLKCSTYKTTIAHAFLKVSEHTVYTLLNLTCLHDFHLRRRSGLDNGDAFYFKDKRLERQDEGLKRLYRGKAELRTSMPNVVQSLIRLYSYQTLISFVRTRLHVENFIGPTQLSVMTG